MQACVRVHQSVSVRSALTMLAMLLWAGVPYHMQYHTHTPRIGTYIYIYGMGHGHRYRTHDEIVRGGLWQMTTHPAIQAGPVHDRMRRMGSERHWLGLGRGPLRRFGMEAIWILEHAGMEPGLLGVGGGA